MAWQHANFDSLTTGTAAKLAELRLHIGEVRQAIANPKQASVANSSWSLNDFVTYLKALKDEEAEMTAAIAAATAGQRFARAGGGYL